MPVWRRFKDEFHTCIPRVALVCLEHAQRTERQRCDAGWPVLYSRPSLLHLCSGSDGLSAMAPTLPLTIALLAWRGAVLVLYWRVALLGVTFTVRNI